MNKPIKQDCIGCKDDFYNGKNEYGIDTCWSLESAEFVRRVVVHINQVPPYLQEPETVPSCYRKQGYSCVSPDVLRADGFWK